MHHHAYKLPVTVFRIEYVFTNMEQFRDGANVHVDDVVRAFLIATLNRRSYGQVFNLAYPVPYMSIRKISGMLDWKPRLRRASFGQISQIHLPLGIDLARSIIEN